MISQWLLKRLVFHWKTGARENALITAFRTGNIHPRPARIADKFKQSCRRRKISIARKVIAFLQEMLSLINYSCARVLSATRLMIWHSFLIVKIEHKKIEEKCQQRNQNRFKKLQRHVACQRHWQLIKLRFFSIAGAIFTDKNNLLQCFGKFVSCSTHQSLKCRYI